MSENNPRKKLRSQGPTASSSAAPQNAPLPLDTQAQIPGPAVEQVAMPLAGTRYQAMMLERRRNRRRNGILGIEAARAALRQGNLAAYLSPVNLDIPPAEPSIPGDDKEQS